MEQELCGMELKPRHPKHYSPATPIGCQSTKKYSSLGIPDVALFDWDAMFIFDFHDMNEDALNPVLARGIWFTEAGKDHSQGQTFRMALYGFLIRALRRHQVIP